MAQTINFKTVIPITVTHNKKDNSYDFHLGQNWLASLELTKLDDGSLGWLAIIDMVGYHKVIYRTYKEARKFITDSIQNWLNDKMEYALIS